MTAPDDVGDVGGVGGGSHRRGDSLGDWRSDPVLRNFAGVEYEGRTVPLVGPVAVTRWLGSGGMAVVLQGRHLRTGADVAVKVLPPALPGSSASRDERFRREARLAAGLRSEHLVWVMDVGEDAATRCLYIVMELVDGVSASRWAQDFAGGLPSEADVLELSLAACRGLEAAHEAGIVHRDVKPSNILVPFDESRTPCPGRAKLADLGLARQGDVEGELTVVGAFLGTPGYVAPEQASDARHAGKRADVFGLGATMYCLLVGDAPFAADTPLQTWLRAKSGQFTPLGERRDDVSRETATLVLQCLAARPEDRPADAGELRRAIEALRAAAAPASGGAAESTNPARPGASEESSRRDRRSRSRGRVRGHRPRSRAGPAVLGVVVVGCALIGGAVVMLRGQFDRPAAVVPVADRRAEPDRPRDDAPPPSHPPPAPEPGSESPPVAHALATAGPAAVPIPSGQGRLRVTGVPPDARVEVDGRAVRSPVDLAPGQHELAVVLARGGRVTFDVEIVGGEERELAVAEPVRALSLIDGAGGDPDGHQEKPR